MDPQYTQVSFNFVCHTLMLKGCSGALHCCIYGLQYFSYINFLVVYIYMIPLISYCIVFNELIKVLKVAGLMQQQKYTVYIQCVSR